MYLPSYTKDRGIGAPGINSQADIQGAINHQMHHAKFSQHVQGLIKQEGHYMTEDQQQNFIF